MSYNTPGVSKTKEEQTDGGILLVPYVPAGIERKRRNKATSTLTWSTLPFLSKNKNLESL